MYEVKSSLVLYSWELCKRSVIIILGVRGWSEEKLGGYMVQENRTWPWSFLKCSAKGQVTLSTILSLSCCTQVQKPLLMFKDIAHGVACHFSHRYICLPTKSLEPQMQ